MSMSNKKSFVVVQLFLSFIICFLSLATSAKDKEPISFIHYSTDFGLPSPYVKSTAQDADGFIWVATRDALVRFDGNEFREFPCYNKDMKFVKEFFNRLFVFNDSLLIAQTNSGLFYYYNTKLESFYFYPLLSNLGPTNNIIPVDNGYWVCQNNQLFYLDAESGKQISLEDKLGRYQIPTNLKFIDVEESNNCLAFVSNKGVAFFVEDQTLVTIDLAKLLSFDSFDLKYIDSDGYAWITSNDYGLARIEISTQKSVVFFEGTLSNSIPHNFIHCVNEDKQKRVWIGTEGGLGVFDMEDKTISVYTSRLNDPEGLQSNPIYDIFCDSEGGTWLGTYFSGLSFSSGQKSFFRKWNAGLGKFQLKSRVVSCFEEEKGNILWIGSEDNGLNKINMETGDVSNYSYTPGKENTISYNNLHDLKLIGKKLWIATYTGGISVLNTITNRFEHFDASNTNGQLSNVNYQFLQAGDSLFIAGSEGIVVYNIKTKVFDKLKSRMISHLQFESITKTGEDIWFSSRNQVFIYNPDIDTIIPFDEIPNLRSINIVESDSKGKIWIGTCYDGLYEYKPESNKYYHYSQSQGFPAGWVFSIEEGNDNQYWVSTSKGLVMLDNNTGKSTLFDRSSGVQISQFNFRASYKDSKDNMYFGGYDGMISFSGKYQEPNEEQTRNIVFTEFKLFDRSVSPNRDGVLSTSIDKIDKLELNYKQNAFTINYSALSYSKKGYCRYSYKLEGNNDTWSLPSEQNFTNYTNLSHGEYVFKVRALNEDNSVSGERSIVIVINPPFWLTPWAYILYCLIIVGVFVLVFRYGKKLEQAKTEAKLEHQEKVHAEKIHKVKLEFYTNISHELKTPLTLIFSPLTQLINNNNLSPQMKKQLRGIERNSKRLYSLINQLLEFRRLEQGKENLAVRECILQELVEDITTSFRSAAEEKGILFIISMPEDDTKVWVDTEKVDKVIFNLLSNAFKYTPEEGEIKLVLNVTGKKHQKLSIDVIDTGIGIEQKNIERIFERFYQVDKSSMINGSGIGLAYTRSLIELHKGEISVDSAIGEGTCFNVSLPSSKNAYKSDEISNPKQYEIATEPKNYNFDNKAEASHFDKTELLISKRTLLIVEDNIEIVDLLRDLFEDDYTVIDAHNGEEALKLFEDEKFSPDVIISDIMMPKMDGITLVKRIKENIKTSHIPIILLTSKAGDESKLEGMLSGADVYIKKPFYPDILKKNVDNIINTRQSLLNRVLKSDNEIKVVEESFSSTDKTFIEKLNDVVSKNITNPKLDVTLLTQEMGISRSLLHLKLKKIMNCSTTEFIRITRLKIAVKLIATGKCNVSEAAYESGFSSPTYFTRCFKEFYGKTPTEYFSLK